MHKLRSIKWLPVLMALSILAIAAFQFYWLQKAYEREQRTLEMRTNFLFRETVFDLESKKLKLERVVGDSARAKIIQKIASPTDRKMANMLDVIVRRAKDSGNREILITGHNDSLHVGRSGYGSRRNRMMQFLFDVDSLQDSVKVKELDTAYARQLNEQNLNVPFSISRVKTSDSLPPSYNEVTLGFARPITYRLNLGNTTPVLLKRISAPIIFSIFLVAFTLLSFTLLYRNLIRQRRLANIKNEFISNITHELKTPIATVSVAIEALRNFNANLNPERTKEYLDISANELQRLSLLVDKVLKLSMFEKKEVELQYEALDMKQIVEEVTSSMRLQFDKHHAQVTVNADKDTSFEGDRLHMLSVIFNLLDNALKYSTDKPKIDIDIKSAHNRLLLTISDSGIGIPAEYQQRIFEKFFRVPTGNLHNAKGYGLGLSYVAHVIHRHHGTIKVESIEGDGSNFIINLPKNKV